MSEPQPVGFCLGKQPMLLLPVLLGCARLTSCLDCLRPPLPALPPPALPHRYVRELEVDYVPLMENSCDPGHVHFTHAGFIGSRDKAGPITVRMLEQARPAANKLSNAA